jgi:hypothetical protein
VVSPVVAFIAGRDALVENPRMVCTHLGAAWLQAFDEEPDFGAPGFGVVGLHVATSDPAIRSLRFSRAASLDAVANAASLIERRHDIRRVHIAGMSAPGVRPHVWAAGMRQRTADLALLSVWRIGGP